MSSNQSNFFRDLASGSDTESDRSSVTESTPESTSTVSTPAVSTPAVSTPTESTPMPVHRGSAPKEEPWTPVRGHRRSGGDRRDRRDSRSRNSAGAGTSNSAGAGTSNTPDWRVGGDRRDSGDASNWRRQGRASSQRQSGRSQRPKGSLADLSNKKVPKGCGGVEGLLSGLLASGQRVNRTSLQSMGLVALLEAIIDGTERAMRRAKGLPDEPDADSDAGSESDSDAGSDSDSDSGSDEEKTPELTPEQQAELKERQEWLVAVSATLKNVLGSTGNSRTLLAMWTEMLATADSEIIEKALLVYTRILGAIMSAKMMTKFWGAFIRTLGQTAEGVATFRVVMADPTRQKYIQTSLHALDHGDESWLIQMMWYPEGFHHESLTTLQELLQLLLDYQLVQRERINKWGEALAQAVRVKTYLRASELEEMLPVIAEELMQRLWRQYQRIMAIDQQLEQYEAFERNAVADARRRRDKRVSEADFRTNDRLIKSLTNEKNGINRFVEESLALARSCFGWTKSQVEAYLCARTSGRPVSPPATHSDWTVEVIARLFDPTFMASAEVEEEYRRLVQDRDNFVRLAQDTLGAALGVTATTPAVLREDADCPPGPSALEVYHLIARMQTTLDNTTTFSTFQQAVKGPNFPSPEQMATALGLTSGQQSEFLGLALSHLVSRLSELLSGAEGSSELAFTKLQETIPRLLFTGVGRSRQLVGQKSWSKIAAWVELMRSCPLSMDDVLACAQAWKMTDLELPESPNLAFLLLNLEHLAQQVAPSQQAKLKSELADLHKSFQTLLRMEVPREVVDPMNLSTFQEWVSQQMALDEVVNAGWETRLHLCLEYLRTAVPKRQADLLKKFQNWAKKDGAQDGETKTPEERARQDLTKHVVDHFTGLLGVIPPAGAVLNTTRLTDWVRDQPLEKRRQVFAEKMELCLKKARAVPMKIHQLRVFNDMEQLLVYMLFRGFVLTPEELEHPFLAQLPRRLQESFSAWAKEKSAPWSYLGRMMTRIFDLSILLTLRPVPGASTNMGVISQQIAQLAEFMNIKAGRPTTLMALREWSSINWSGFTSAGAGSAGSWVLPEPEPETAEHLTLDDVKKEVRQIMSMLSKSGRWEENRSDVAERLATLWSQATPADFLPTLVLQLVDPERRSLHEGDGSRPLTLLEPFLDDVTRPVLQSWLVQASIQDDIALREMDPCNYDPAPKPADWNWLSEAVFGSSYPDFVAQVDTHCPPESDVTPEKVQAVIQGLKPAPVEADVLVVEEADTDGDTEETKQPEKPRSRVNLGKWGEGPVDPHVKFGFDPALATPSTPAPVSTGPINFGFRVSAEPASAPEPAIGPILVEAMSTQDMEKGTVTLLADFSGTVHFKTFSHTDLEHRLYRFDNGQYAHPGPDGKAPKNVPGVKKQNSTLYFFADITDPVTGQVYRLLAKRKQIKKKGKKSKGKGKGHGRK